MSDLNDWMKNNIAKVKQTRKCQRNWDHSKQMPEDHVQHLIDVAVNSPAKQDENYFDLYVITNRELLQDLYFNHSWGFVVENDVQYRNPQVNSHVFFIWARKIPDTNRNAWVDNSLKESQPFSRVWVNCLTAIGISSGMVALTASHMGYHTGFNKNFFQQPNSYKKWVQSIGHREPCHPDAEPDDYTLGMSNPEWVCPYSGQDSTIVHGLGVGFPDSSIEWYQSKDTQYMTSAPNDKIEGEVDSLSMPGIVHQMDQDVIEFGPWSHDPETDQPVSRNHLVKWIK